MHRSIKPTTKGEYIDAKYKLVLVTHNPLMVYIN